MSDNSDDIKQLFAHLGLNPADYQEIRGAPPAAFNASEPSRRWSLLQAQVAPPSVPLGAGGDGPDHTPQWRDDDSGHPAQSRDVIDAALSRPSTPTWVPNRLTANDHLPIPAPASLPPAPPFAGSESGNAGAPDEDIQDLTVDGLQSLFESVQESALRINAASVASAARVALTDVPPAASLAPSPVSSPASPRVEPPPLPPAATPLSAEAARADAPHARPATYPGRLQLSLQDALDPAPAPAGELLQDIFRRIAAGGER